METCFRNIVTTDFDILSWPRCVNSVRPRIMAKGLRAIISDWFSQINIDINAIIQPLNQCKISERYKSSMP